MFWISRHIRIRLIKPLNVIETLIGNSTRPGDIVLDPFMGSGTTAVACMELGRKYIGYEINKGYFEVAQRRIQDTIEQLNL